MFDSLSDRLQGIVKRLKGKGRLTEADVDEVMGEIRTALLEADVNVGYAHARCHQCQPHSGTNNFLDSWRSHRHRNAGHS